MQAKTSKLPKLSGRHGFIMLALLLILVITGSTFVLAGLNNRGSVYLEQQTELHRQMAEAKANLLAYVANSNAIVGDGRGPGFFPCPDTNNNGTEDSPCDPIDAAMPVCTPDAATYAGGPKPLVGRLPEFVLDASGSRIALNDHYAKVDQQFWYVVAPRFVYNLANSAYRRSEYRTSVSTTPTDTQIAPACMQMYQDSNAGYVAFIIAPGEALGTQDRASNRTSYTSYLDGQNGASNYHYYTSYDSNPEAFNDQIIGITLSEYVKAVGIRVAIETKNKIDAYHVATGAYPASSADFSTLLGTATNPAWLIPDTATGNNGELWSKDVVYARNSDDVSTISFSGCAGISYTLAYSTGITRTGVSCS